MFDKEDLGLLTNRLPRLWAVPARSGRRYCRPNQCACFVFPPHDTRVLGSTSRGSADLVFRQSLSSYVSFTCHGKQCTSRRDLHSSNWFSPFSFSSFMYLFLASEIPVMFLALVGTHARSLPIVCGDGRVITDWWVFEVRSSLVNLRFVDDGEVSILRLVVDARRQKKVTQITKSILIDARKRLRCHNNGDEVINQTIIKNDQLN